MPRNPAPRLIYDVCRPILCPPCVYGGQCFSERLFASDKARCALEQYFSPFLSVSISLSGTYTPHQAQAAMVSGVSSFLSADWGFFALREEGRSKSHTTKPTNSRSNRRKNDMRIVQISFTSGGFEMGMGKRQPFHAGFAKIDMHPRIRTGLCIYDNAKTKFGVTNIHPDPQPARKFW